MKEAIALKRKRMDLDTTQIYNTKDYDIFRKKDGNRDISQPLVNKLYKSILLHGYYDISIIVIGDNMAILDGQHRIEALKRIKSDTGAVYRIKYIVSREFDDLNKIISWQTERSSWNTLDYARSFALLGNDNYQCYLDFRAKFKINHTVSQLLLSGGSKNDKTQVFKTGQFRVDDYSRAEDWVLRLQSIATYYDFAYNRSFVRALIPFWKHPKFSHREFMEKIEKYRKLLYNCVNVPQFRDLISELYNYRRRERIKFDFDN